MRVARDEVGCFGQEDNLCALGGGPSDDVLAELEVVLDVVPARGGRPVSPQAKAGCERVATDVEQI